LEPSRHDIIAEICAVQSVNGHTCGAISQTAALTAAIAQKKPVTVNKLHCKNFRNDIVQNLHCKTVRWFQLE